MLSSNVRLLPDPDIRVVDTAVPEPAGKYSTAEPVLVHSARLIDASVVGSQWILLVAAPCPSHPAQDDQCIPTIRMIDGSDRRVLTPLPALPGWDPVALDDTGRAVLLRNDTTGVLARYGLRSEVTIAWAVAGDWYLACRHRVGHGGRWWTISADRRGGHPSSRSRTGPDRHRHCGATRSVPRRRCVETPLQHREPDRDIFAGHGQAEDVRTAHW
jgi:hypothetical protein